MAKFDFTALRNIGKKTAENLENMGISDLEEMKKIGTEELFFRYFQSKGGWHSGMCTCWLYVIEGAMTDTNWWEIPDKKKKQKEKYVYERGVWMVDLEPTIGIEIKKTRPCIILMKFSKKHFVIIPITSKEKDVRFAYNLGKPDFLHKSTNYINISQIRTVDISRFQRYLGKISTFKFQNIQKKSAEVLKLLPRGTNVHNESIVKTISEI